MVYDWSNVPKPENYESLSYGFVSRLSGNLKKVIDKLEGNLSSENFIKKSFTKRKIKYFTEFYEVVNEFTSVIDALKTTKDIKEVTTEEEKRLAISDKNFRLSKYREIKRKLNWLYKNYNDTIYGCYRNSNSNIWVYDMGELTWGDISKIPNNSYRSFFCGLFEGLHIIVEKAEKKVKNQKIVYKKANEVKTSSISSNESKTVESLNIKTNKEQKIDIDRGYTLPYDVSTVDMKKTIEKIYNDIVKRFKENGVIITDEEREIITEILNKLGVTSYYNYRNIDKFLRYKYSLNQDIISEFPLVYMVDNMKDVLDLLLTDLLSSENLRNHDVVFADFRASNLLVDYNNKYKKLEKYFKNLSKADKELQLYKMQERAKVLNLDVRSFADLSPESFIKIINKRVSEQMINRSEYYYAASNKNYYHRDLEIVRASTFMEIEEIAAIYRDIKRKFIFHENSEMDISYLKANFTSAIYQILINRGYINYDEELISSILREIRVDILKEEESLDKNKHKPIGLVEKIKKKKFDIIKENFEKDSSFGRLKNQRKDLSRKDNNARKF